MFSLDEVSKYFDYNRNNLITSDAATQKREAKANHPNKTLKSRSKIVEAMKQ